MKNRFPLIARPVARLVSFLLLGGAGSCPLLSGAGDDSTLVVEPETFIALDAWQKVGTHIQSSNLPGTAFAGVNIERAGNYRLWTCSQDNISSHTGKRRFLIKIDGKPAARESGSHGKDGWHWEQIGEMQLDAGLHMIEVADTARFFGRLDAILFTTDDLDPNTKPRSAWNRFRVPVVQPRRILRGDASGQPAPDRAAAPLAELSNSAMRIVFRTARAADGSQRMWRDVVFKTAAGAAQTVGAGSEPLFLISSKKNNAAFASYFPAWKNAAQVDWQLGDRVMRRAADVRDPYAAGELAALEPVAARAIAPDTVEVDYQEIGAASKTSSSAAAGSATGSAPAPRKTARVLWKLAPDGIAPRMEISCTVPEDGWYSLAFGCGQPVSRDEVAGVMLPPLYQFRRVPDGPEVVTSSLASRPFALIEQRAQEKTHGLPGITRGLLAAPDRLSHDWPTRTNAPCAFTLVSPGGDAQPWIFSPILGADNSHKKSGETLAAAWHVLIAPQSWENVMRAADTRLYGLSDYREPVTTSLTEQALNIIDLMSDDKAGGWDARLKGPENIESPSTVTHASPLMYFSAALLKQDEKLFTARALPTFEFLLSRPGAHFALSTQNNLYVTKHTARIAYKHTFFGSAVWQGVDDLTRGLNPWLDAYIHQSDGRPLTVSNGSSETDWSGWLAVYRQRPDPALLKRIQANVDGWITRAFETNPNLSAPVAIQSFYNVSFYPYWWDLADLYQLTGEKRYLDAARLGAAQTIAGLWVAPRPQQQNITLYPENKYTSNHVVWWKGDDAFRLGWPADSKAHTRTTATFTLAEKQVPQWTVSPVGLGLEQPTTYFSACSNGMSNIMLSVWAANLLRLYGETGDEYFHDFARNTIIGRGANYPGYYLSAYTDIMQKADYPRTGPDLTSFYWHHAPVHLAMLVDYIVTDADVRTRGAIRFPYAKQQGYVWFSSRIYGGQPGRVFDDPACRLIFDRNAFRADSPKVDYFGARGEKKFHLVILNQARRSAATRITLDRAALKIAPNAKPLLRITGNTNAATKPKLTTDAEGRYVLTLPERGIAVLSFDAAGERVIADIPKLETRPIAVELGKTWGQMRAFRIRSPFGQDSLYTVLDGRPPEGCSARLEIENGGEQQLAAFPFEFTQTGVSLARTIRFRLHLSEPNAAPVTTQWFELPGTK